MKPHSVLFVFCLFFIPSLSFADPAKDNVINAHPVVDMDALERAAEPILDKIEKDKKQTPEYKALEKKAHALEAQRNTLNENERKRYASYIQCWSGCPNVQHYGGDDYRCYSKSCSNCGTNCVNRFGKAKLEIQEKLDKLESEIDTVYGELDHKDMNIGAHADEYRQEIQEAAAKFNSCVKGNMNGEAVYMKRTYTSLDECLKAIGWERISK